MRRVKAEVAIIGSGAMAQLAAHRLIGQGANAVLVNPRTEFDVEDLRPHSGLGLWNAAYRSEKDETLSGLYATLVERMREVFPATIEQSGLRRTDYWSVLSNTLIHRDVTEELEKEFFKLERKPWSAGQFRLVSPDYIQAVTRRFGVDLPSVAAIEGAVVRNYGLWWDAPRMGYHLCHFTKTKLNENCFVGARIEGRYGRKIVVSTREGEEISIESDRAVLIFLTGELLPHLKTIVSSCDEPWIQGVRKRRREQHFIWFERPGTLPSEVEVEPIWMELGNVRYRWWQGGGLATWRSGKGPDGLERAVDEGLRLQCVSHPNSKFVQSRRAFSLEWDWKNPQWRETSHETKWATSFEGDLWGIMELLWNLPTH